MTDVSMESFDEDLCIPVEKPKRVKFVIDDQVLLPDVLSI